MYTFTIVVHIANVYIILLPDFKTHSKYLKSVPNTIKHEGYKSVAEIDDRHWSQETIPKPKHKIDLLVDDVLGQDT